jgi:hypothetical protein
MVRFKPGHKLGEAFYVRGDGTRAYYFTTEKLTQLFAEQGFEQVECGYVTRETTYLLKSNPEFNFVTAALDVNLLFFLQIKPINDYRYVAKETSNRKMGVCVPRVYAQGKFRKL